VLKPKKFKRGAGSELQRRDTSSGIRLKLI